MLFAAHTYLAPDLADRGTKIPVSYTVAPETTWLFAKDGQPLGSVTIKPHLENHDHWSDVRYTLTDHPNQKRWMPLFETVICMDLGMIPSKTFLSYNEAVDHILRVKEAWEA